MQIVCRRCCCVIVAYAFFVHYMLCTVNGETCFSLTADVVLVMSQRYVQRKFLVGHSSDVIQNCNALYTYQ